MEGARGSRRLLNKVATNNFFNQHGREMRITDLLITVSIVRYHVSYFKHVIHRERQKTVGDQNHQERALHLLEPYNRSSHKLDDTSFHVRERRNQHKVSKKKHVLH